MRIEVDETFSVLFFGVIFETSLVHDNIVDFKNILFIKPYIGHSANFMQRLSSSSGQGFTTQN